jgi:hypothetical protein
MGIAPRRFPSRSPAKTTEKPSIAGTLTVAGHQLQLFPIKEVEVDGIVAMGVLSDGTPYLTLRGLARMCGVDHAALLRLANNWDDEQTKPRGVKIKELLAAQGHQGTVLNVQTTTQGVDTHVYTDAVCMAVLEYYAFEATQGDSTTAIKNYRLLARHSFRTFIYKTCDYDPDRHIPDSWRNFHERVLLNDQLPVGYFSIFREIADIVVHMIKGGCPLDSHTVPDISVGQIWAKHWADSGFDETYGARTKHPHVYPEWFPQSAVNPVPAWIYPASAMGVFHNWLHRNYIPQNFPKYVQGKVKAGTFLPARGALLIEAVSRKTLPPA